MKCHSIMPCLLALLLATSARAGSFEQGETLYQGKHFGQARQAYLAASQETQVTTMPMTARLRAALCLYDQQDYEGFKREGEALVKECQGQRISKAMLTKYRLANVPMMLGKWAEAAEALGAFATENPKCEYTFDALNNQAKALGKLGRRQEARQIYLDYIGKFPKSPFLKKARLKSALCLYDMGDYDAFEREGKAVLDQYPASSHEDAEWVRLHLAQMPGKREGRWLESAQQLEALLAAEPTPKLTLYHVRIDCGEAYVKAAGPLAQAGASARMTELRAKGRKFLQEARTELEGLLASGARKKDNADLRTMILESYCFEEDYAGLAAAAQALVDEQSSPSAVWARGMVFLGIARANQTPPDQEGAKKAFDALLAANVQDAGAGNEVPAAAAYWRAAIAETQKDEAGLQAAVDKLRQMPESLAKKAALARFAVRGK